ncbi:hypothetical protein KP509_21G079900 [Ceratopteris richardii]|nr:hypothetical protein KP509_21G079900 [Ceratopteris richardii]
MASDPQPCCDDDDPSGHTAYIDSNTYQSARSRQLDAGDDHNDHADDCDDDADDDNDGDDDDDAVSVPAAASADDDDDVASHDDSNDNPDDTNDELHGVSHRLQHQGLHFEEARPPLEPASGRFVHRNDNVFNAGSGSAGEKNMAGFSREFGSSSLATPRRPHSGTLRPLSGTRPLRIAPGTTHGTIRKTSIIPTVLRSTAGAAKSPYPREPLSPQITCLGRIRDKHFRSEPRDAVHGSGKPNVERKGRETARCCSRCLDTNSHPCGRRRGRKKNEKTRCLCRRRFASAGSRSAPSTPQPQLSQTRREKAAILAQTLTDLIADMRQAQGTRSDNYIPTEPPPNSLLLMREYRKGRRTAKEDESNEPAASTARGEDLGLLSRSSLSSFPIEILPYREAETSRNTSELLQISSASELSASTAIRGKESIPSKAENSFAATKRFQSSLSEIIEEEPELELQNRLVLYQRRSFPQLSPIETKHRT